MKVLRGDRVKMFVVGVVASLTMTSFAYFSGWSRASTAESASSTARLMNSAGRSISSVSSRSLKHRTRGRIKVDYLRPSGDLFSPFEAALKDAQVSQRSRNTPVSVSCKIKALQSLGWKLSYSSSSDRVSYVAKRPCNHQTIRDAQERGDFQLVIPEGLSGMNQESLNSQLDKVMNSEASVCAYKYKVGAAARRAADLHILNEDFTFPEREDAEVISFSRGDRSWIPGCYYKGAAYCHTPATSSISDALDVFTRGSVVAGCAVGLQVVELEMLRQLYGAAFNERFSQEEAFIGQIWLLPESKNVMWSEKNKADLLLDPYAEKAARMGPRWLEGLSGYIGNIYDHENADAYFNDPDYKNPFLDKPMDQGENFMVMSVTDNAFQQLRSEGGFQRLNQVNQEIWRLSRGLSNRAKKFAGSSEKLEHFAPYLRKDRDYPMSRLPDDLRRIEQVRKIRNFLQEPIYNGVKVYVHPLGVMTFREHITRLLSVNPRVAYVVDLYPSRVHSGLFRRYVNHLLESCEL